MMIWIMQNMHTNTFEQLKVVINDVQIMVKHGQLMANDLFWCTYNISFSNVNGWLILLTFHSKICYYFKGVRSINLLICYLKWPK